MTASSSLSLRGDSAVSDYMLELCDVSKSFPGVKALDGVSFALRRRRSTLWLARTALGSRLSSRSSQECIGLMEEGSYSTGQRFHSLIH